LLCEKPFISTIDYTEDNISPLFTPGTRPEKVLLALGPTDLRRELDARASHGLISTSGSLEIC
jgi:hypothetical protein